MSLAKAVVFSRQLKGVTIERSGPPPLEASAHKAELEKSYARGYQEASDKFNAQILAMRQEMQGHAHGVLTQIESAYDQLTKDLSSQLPELIVAGVYRVIGENSMDPAVLKSRVDAMIAESCPAGETVEATLCPSDLEALHALDDDFAAKHPRINFKSDSALKVGDCVMRTKFGQVDARIKTQLTRLLSELTNV